MNGNQMNNMSLVYIMLLFLKRLRRHILRGFCLTLFKNRFAFLCKLLLRFAVHMFLNFLRDLWDFESVLEELNDLFFLYLYVIAAFLFNDSLEEFDYL